MNKHILTALQALREYEYLRDAHFDGEPQAIADRDRAREAIRYLSHLAEMTRDPDGDDPLGLHARWLVSADMSVLAAIEKLLDGSATPATNSMIRVFLMRARADAPAMTVQRPAADVARQDTP